jgi:hypothetical protein
MRTLVRPPCFSFFPPLLVLLGSAGAARADTTERDHIFFEVAAGGGLAWIDHPEASRSGKPGAVPVLAFGWAPNRRWAIGGEFTTWLTNHLATPVHLHTIGPRIELAPNGPLGLFARGTLGYALTEGNLIEVRPGGGAGLSAGWRWQIGRGVALAASAGAHAHLYASGTALFPFVSAELRYYGARPGP